MGYGIVDGEINEGCLGEWEEGILDLGRSLLVACCAFSFLAVTMLLGSKHRQSAPPNATVITGARAE